MELKTYNEWAAYGRVVGKGERAAFYRISPEGDAGAAVFSKDQTLPLSEEPSKHWTTVVPAAEWKNRQGRTNKKNLPVVRVDSLHSNGTGVSVWCGSDKTAIGWLKRAGYLFDMSTHRWYQEDRDADRVIAGFKATKVCNVIDERDEQDLPVI